MIIAELQKRGIDARAEMPEAVSMLSFEYQGQSCLMMGCTPDFSSAVSIPICRSKLMTEWIVRKETDVPMPATLSHATWDESVAFLNQYGNIVVKPQDGAHGRGVTVGVSDEDGLRTAIESAREYSQSDTVLLQELVIGKDVRVLVIDGDVVAAVYRIPPTITGDGTRTIRELIEAENLSNPDRGDSPYVKKLNKIDLQAAERFLGAQIDTVLSSGEQVTVVGTANIGTGGEADECLAELPESMKQHAVDAAGAARAFICGVDFMYDSTTGTYQLIELNASPSFGLHMFPSKGQAIDVARIYVDALLKRLGNNPRPSQVSYALKAERRPQSEPDNITIDEDTNQEQDNEGEHTR